MSHINFTRFASAVVAGTAVALTMSACSSISSSDAGSISISSEAKDIPSGLNSAQLDKLAASVQNSVTNSKESIYGASVIACAVARSSGADWDAYDASLSNVASSLSDVNGLSYNVKLMQSDNGDGNEMMKNATRSTGSPDVVLCDNLSALRSLS